MWSDGGNGRSRPFFTQTQAHTRRTAIQFIFGHSWLNFSSQSVIRLNDLVLRPLHISPCTTSQAVKKLIPPTAVASILNSHFRPCGSWLVAGSQ